METKDIILELRTKKGLSQDELAEKLFVTRQAVSRWENGETIPNIETLKLLSRLFDVSINTLLGSPREMVCHCCGMSLDDSTTSKEIDGIFNEEYCKWCYSGGEFTMDFWKLYPESDGEEKFGDFKKQLIDELNALQIDGMPKVDNLNVLSGSFINLEYTLPSGEKVKFLDDNATYLGNQLPSKFGDDRCFGIAANMQFLLVCTYKENGEEPILIMYKYRNEVQTRWGETEAYREHEEKTKDYGKEQWDSLAKSLDAIMCEFAACKQAGFLPGSPEAKSLVKKLQNHITENFYTCTNEILSGLGLMYVGDERFKTNIDHHGEGTAEYINLAIANYCAK